jgi:hypothetical protein
MVRALHIVSNAKLLFQTLVEKQSLEFDYVLTARQRWKNVKQLPLVTIAEAVKIVS